MMGNRRLDQEPHELLGDDLGCTRRFPDRAALSLVCSVRQGVQPWRALVIEDVSQSGFRIVGKAQVDPEAPLHIRLPGIQPLSASVRWISGEEAGCEFDAPLHVSVFEHLVREAQTYARA